MAEKDSTTKTPEKWEWLGDLFDRSLWPLESFIRLIDEREAYEDLLAVLTPLVEGIKSDLDVIDEVLGQAFGGHIMVEVIDHPDPWKPLKLGNYKGAFAKPATATNPLTPEGGAE